MITLGEARTRVTERLAETSGVFWSDTARNRAVNDAVRLVATVTKGVEDTFTPEMGETSVDFGSSTLTGVNFVTAKYGAYSLPAVSADEVSLINRCAKGSVGLSPRWLVVDERSNEAFLHPTPASALPWSVDAHVLPGIVTVDSDPLFLGKPIMDKYITPTVLLACAYLLLQERFDGDAERFYQLALQELTMLGVDATTIPPLQAGLGPKQVA